MSKVKDFNTYVDSKFGSKYNNSHIKESLTDYIANAIDSIMPFSKTKTINYTIDNILEYEKDLLKQKYDLEKNLSKLQMKMIEIRGRTPVNHEAVVSIKKEVEARKIEYKAMVKSKTIAIEKAKELLRKEASKSPRLKDVMKAKMAEMEIELAEFEYDLAKKNTAETSEIENLKNALDQAKREATELLTKLTAAPTP